MKGDVRAQPSRGVMHHVTAVIVLAISLSLPSSAKLFSTKAQEAKMVGRAVEISENWNRYLNDTYGKNDGFADEIRNSADAAARFGGGVLRDMAILNEMARLHFHALRGDEKSYRAMDEFDPAAEELCAGDRQRYYTAKATLRSQLARRVDASLKATWYFLLVNDWSRAARLGQDAEVGIAAVRRFAQTNELKSVLVDEAVCRIRYEHARYFLAEAGSFHARNKDADAFKTAVRGLSRIPAGSKLDSGACNKWKSDDAVLSSYDRFFIQPLSTSAGSYHQEVIAEACKRHWKHTRLVAKLLPRIRTPSPDAFALFTKAGKDPMLRNDAAIAKAEYLLWKKAGKANDFKKRYPERYRLAVPASSR